jgi:hypothetical protein
LTCSPATTSSRPPSRCQNWQGGKVDFGALDHPWEAGLSGVVNQTYYAVPLGYRSGSSTREAPN